MLHAVFRWDGRDWQLENHSHNGTWVDGARVEPLQPCRLNTGCQLQFARTNAGLWQLLDLAPPCAVLEAVDHESDDITLHSAYRFSSDDSIECDSEGQWWHRSSHWIKGLIDGETLSINEQLWRFRSDCPLVVTQRVPRLPMSSIVQPRAIFGVSEDEEHVSLRIEEGHGTVDLGERIHHYLLLILARQRLADADKGVDPDSQGWIYVEDLIRMLGVGESYVNIQIHRARRQIRQSGLRMDVVERRSGRVRIGPFGIRILRGSKLEGELSDTAAHTDMEAWLLNPHSSNPHPSNVDTLSPIPGLYLEAVLGIGGSATVYRARQQASGRRVALKVPHRNSPGAREQFKRQRNIHARLHHPHIACLLDSGRDAHRLDYCVFEYVPGETLDHWLAAHGPMSIQQAVALMTQVLDALTYAHQHRAVHGDLTPNNIMLFESDHALWAKVLDFGNDNAGDDARHTSFGFCTPSYCAPELLRGKASSPSSDLYSWGLILLECLSGQPAIAGRSVVEILAQQLGEQVPPLPGQLVGHPLGALLQRVLAKDPCCRPSRGDRLWRELRTMGERVVGPDTHVREGHCSKAGMEVLWRFSLLSHHLPEASPASCNRV